MKKKPYSPFLLSRRRRMTCILTLSRYKFYMKIRTANTTSQETLECGIFSYKYAGRKTKGVRKKFEVKERRKLWRKKKMTKAKMPPAHLWNLKMLRVFLSLCKSNGGLQYTKYPVVFSLRSFISFFSSPPSNYTLIACKEISNLHPSPIFQIFVCFSFLLIEQQLC